MSVSGRLKYYVMVVSAAGLLTFAAAAASIDLARGMRQLPLIVVFALLVCGGELFPIMLRPRGHGKEVLVTSTFAYALVLLTGIGTAVVVVVVAATIADLQTRKPAVKLIFNAAQYALALAAGGGVYLALGGGEVRLANLGAVLLGAAVFGLANHVLVSTAVSLAAGAKVLPGLFADLSVEVASSLMLLGLSPVAVVVAERSVALVPLLLIPLFAVHRAVRAEVVAKDLAEQEQRVVRRLEETDRMKADLTAMVTHELRSPLTTIEGVYYLLGEHADRLPRQEVAELVRMGSRQSDRLRRMIEHLLLAARFENGQPATVLAASARAELDAAGLLQQARAEAQARYQDRHITVDARDPLPVLVAGDAVSQVLGNLIDNACKYTPLDQAIRLRASRQGGDVVLAVEDGGPGIPGPERERIFERFTQLESSNGQRDGGIGLGLFIARQLARSQGGDLLVTDAPSGGARFEVRLPLHAPRR